MADGSGITLKETDPADLVVPPAGKDTLFIDSTQVPPTPAFKDAAGVTHSLKGADGAMAPPRTTTVASSATPAINVDTTDIFTITALAVAVTSFTTNLTGTPVNGQHLTIRLLDNGTARALAWGAKFAARGAALPSTTVAGKYLYVGLIWNSTTTTFDCVAAAQEA